MKNKIIFCFTVIVLLFSSCNGNLDENDSFYDDIWPSYRYYLSISIKDATGRDLVAPLSDDQWMPEGDSYWTGNINPERYTFDIKLSNPDEWISRRYIGKGNYSPKFMLVHSDGTDNYWLFSDCANLRKNGIQNPLLFCVTCPTIFGENSVHEIATYWDEDPAIPADERDAVRGALYPECIKALFDGKEVIVKKSLYQHTEQRDYYNYLIEIKLDK